MADAITQSSGGSVAKKRLLFNKPSWSKPQALSNGANLFHRSNQTYVDSAAEAERKRKKKLARKERERSHREDGEARSGKRRRTSSDEENGSSGSSSDEKPSRVEGPKVTPTPKKEGHIPIPASVNPQRTRPSPKTLLKRYEAEIDAKVLGIAKKLKAKPSDIINIDDDDDDVELQAAKDHSDLAVVSPPRPSASDDQPPSDEEFPELARQARDKARRKRLEADIVSNTPEPSPSGSSNSQLQRSQSLRQSTPPPPAPDPVLQILITSTIPNTEPLIVNRKLSQRLKEVRITWTERQQFTPDFGESVFLTWRGRRLFDVASCKSLGITVDPNGNIRTRGDSLDDLDGKIHMEAMTAEIFEAYKRAKKHEVAEGTEAPIEEPILVEEKKEPQIRIILKARGFADVKIIVKPVSCAPTLRLLMDD